MMEKAENAGKQHFLLFPPCFLPYQRLEAIFETHYSLDANAVYMEESTILSVEKEATNPALFTNSYLCINSIISQTAFEVTGMIFSRTLELNAAVQGLVNKIVDTTGQYGLFQKYDLKVWGLYAIFFFDYGD